MSSTKRVQSSLSRTSCQIPVSVQRLHHIRAQALPSAMPEATHPAPWQYKQAQKAESEAMYSRAGNRPTYKIPGQNTFLTWSPLSASLSPFVQEGSKKKNWPLPHGRSGVKSMQARVTRNYSFLPQLVLLQWITSPNYPSHLLQEAPWTATAFFLALNPRGEQEYIHDIMSSFSQS